MSGGARRSGRRAGEGAEGAAVLERTEGGRSRCGGDVRGGAEEADDRGVTVMQDGHGVEEVSNESRAVLHGVRRDIRRCDAVEAPGTR